jgi:hypothetical protein
MKAGQWHTLKKTRGVDAVQSDGLAVNRGLASFQGRLQIRHSYCQYNVFSFVWTKKYVWERKGIERRGEKTRN